VESHASYQDLHILGLLIRTRAPLLLLVGYKEKMSMDQEDQTAIFESWPEGSILMTKTDDYWVKPEQSEQHHLEYMLVNLFSGKVVHFSRVGKLILIHRG